MYLGVIAASLEVLQKSKGTPSTLGVFGHPQARQGELSIQTSARSMPIAW